MTGAGLAMKPSCDGRQCHGGDRGCQRSTISAAATGAGPRGRQLLARPAGKSVHRGPLWHSLARWAAGFSGPNGSRHAALGAVIVKRAADLA